MTRGGFEKECVCVCRIGCEREHETVLFLFSHSGTLTASVFCHRITATPVSIQPPSSSLRESLQGSIVFFWRGGILHQFKSGFRLFLR